MIIIKNTKKSIISEKLKRYKTKTGIYYLPKFAYQDVIRNEIIKNRIFDKEVFDLGKQYIKDNTIVIDAGSNFGQMSILFSKVKKRVDIYSFEASPYIFKILKKNIQINNPKIKIFNLILDDKSKKNFLKNTKLKFGTYGAESLSLSNKKLDDTKTVSSIRIDDLQFKKKISFMKIDVQGMDLKVLKGSKKTILKHKMPIIFEYEDIFEKKFNYKFHDYVQFVNEINYKFETVFKNNFLIIPK